jgi:DNA-binding MarR family transcriptional regulator
MAYTLNFQESRITSEAAEPLQGARPRRESILKIACPEDSIPCNNATLRQAARMLGQLYDDVLEPSGLRATQHVLLELSRSMDGPTLREMATALVMDLSALGHSLKPLERDGLVALVPDERDGRAKRVRLTRNGEKKLQQTGRLWRQAQERFDTVFGRDKAADLRATLNLLSSPDFRQAFEQRRPLGRR